MLSITLYITEDIEFMTPLEFDPPTPRDLERERQLSVAMSLWAEDYNERMAPVRDSWMNEVWNVH